MVWYVARGGRPEGPFPWETLVDGAERATLLPDDLVWREGLPEWVPARRIPRLFADHEPKRESGPAPLAARPAETSTGAQNAGAIGASGRRSSVMGYVATHWRGGHSLARSYWINGVALTLAMTAAVAVLSGLRLADPRHSGLLILSVLVSAILLAVWQITGTWRSASQHTGRGGKRFWAYAVKVLVVANACIAAVELTRTTPPLVVAALGLISGGDGVPKPRFNILRGGTELEIAGGLAHGTADTLGHFLDAGPAIKVVHLNSVGGSLEEGFRIHRLIKERKLNTYTASECVSACTLAFVAGRRRYLGSTGRLGFHSASIGGAGGDVFPEINDEMAQTFLGHGVPSRFVQKALATAPASMWYPTQDELVAARVVTEIVDPAAFAVSGIEDRSDVEEFERWLLSVPVYAVLKEKDGAAYGELAAIWTDGIRQGRSAGEIGASIQTLFSRSIIPRYVTRAPDGALVRYWQSQIAELVALLKSDPRRCVDFLFPEAAKSPLDLEALLPEALLAEDRAALTVLVSETAVAPVVAERDGAGASGLERAARTLSEKHPDLALILLEPEKHRERPAELCSATIGLYLEIMALEKPGPVLRDLARRSMASRPERPAAPKE